jgi:hypothetical protein
MQAEYDKIVGDWVKRGTIEKCPYKKLIWVNPTHLVPKQGEKFRLITDCTKVNRFMKHTQFKMEGVPSLRDIIEKNEYAITFDLKEAYNHVPVHHSMKNLLGMCWRREAYRFVGMPFTLNNTPRVFTKIINYVEYKGGNLPGRYIDSPPRQISPRTSWKRSNSIPAVVGMDRECREISPCPISTVLVPRMGVELRKDGRTLTAERKLKTLDELRRMKSSVHNHKLIPVCNVAKLMGIFSAARIQFPLESLHLMKINALKSRGVRDYG